MWEKYLEILFFLLIWTKISFYIKLSQNVGSWLLKHAATAINLSMPV